MTRNPSIVGQRRSQPTLTAGYSHNHNSETGSVSPFLRALTQPLPYADYFLQEPLKMISANCLAKFFHYRYNFLSHLLLMAGKTRSMRLRPRIPGPKRILYKAHFRRHSIANKPAPCGENVTIAERMPGHSWDTHMHVTDPNYPEAPDAEYTPGLHNLSNALSFESTIGIKNIVMIQPSIYGNDNTLLINALTKLGTGHGRGVVGFDVNTTSLEALQEWHKLGVRGVRLNIKSNNVKLTEAQLQAQVKQYAKLIKPLNWVLELYIGMDDIPKLEPVAAELGVTLSIAHFGAPNLPLPANRTLPFDPYTLTGFQSLVSLLKAGDTYIKFSGPYRFDTDPQYRGIEGIALELLKFAGDRIIFASDWPHTRFEGLDIRPFVEKVLDWTEERGLKEKVFSRNAHVLWDIPFH